MAHVGKMGEASSLPCGMVTCVPHSAPSQLCCEQRLRCTGTAPRRHHPLRRARALCAGPATPGGCSEPGLRQWGQQRPGSFGAWPVPGEGGLAVSVSFQLYVPASHTSSLHLTVPVGGIEVTKS